MAIFTSGCANLQNVAFWGGSHAASQHRKIGDAPTSPNLFIFEFKMEGGLHNDNFSPLFNRIQKARKPPLIVGFIHGWKNSAERSNSNLAGFNKFLSKLSDEPQFAERTIIGVYCGWPASPPQKQRLWLDNFDFKARRDLADIIGTSGSLDALICETADEAEKVGGQVIWSGHSLGGRMLERSILSMARESEGLPGNFMGLLLSPAIASTESFELRREMDGAAPLSVISLTSRNDYAIRDAFTGSNWIFGVSELSDSKSSDLPSGQNRRVGAAFDNSMVTHYIDDRNAFIELLEKGEVILKEELKKRIRARERKRNQIVQDAERRKKLAAKPPSDIAILRTLGLFDPEKQSIRNPQFNFSAAGNYLEQLKSSESWRDRIIEACSAEYVFKFRRMPTTYGKGDFEWLVFSPSEIDSAQQAYPVISASPKIIDGHSNFVGLKNRKGTGDGILFSSALASFIGELCDIRFNQKDSL